jgi:hypothetical protein
MGPGAIEESSEIKEAAAAITIEEVRYPEVCEA